MLPPFPKRVSMEEAERIGREETIKQFDPRVATVRYDLDNKIFIMRVDDFTVGSLTADEVLRDTSADALQELIDSRLEEWWKPMLKKLLHAMQCRIVGVVPPPFPDLDGPPPGSDACSQFQFALKKAAEEMRTRAVPAAVPAAPPKLPRTWLDRLLRRNK